MEKVVTFGDFNHLAGVLSEGIVKHPENRRPCVIILNAGLVHRVGPNRIYVKLARLLAQHGVDVLRFDFPGVGDSFHRKDNLPISKSVLKEVASAMDFLSKNGIAEEFILLGICSGANNSLRAAFEDARVVGAAAINYQPPDTQFGRALKQSSFYTDMASTNISSWKRFLSGRSSYRRIMSAVFTKMRMWVVPQTMFALDGETRQHVAWIKNVLKELQQRNMRLLMVTSDGDTGNHYVKQVAKSDVRVMINNGLLQFKTVLGADHMFTPLESQKKLFEIVLPWVLSFQDDAPIYKRNSIDRTRLMLRPQVVEAPENKN